MESSSASCFSLLPPRAAAPPPPPLSLSLTATSTTSPRHSETWLRILGAAASSPASPPLSLVDRQRRLLTRARLPLHRFQPPYRARRPPTPHLPLRYRCIDYHHLLLICPRPLPLGFLLRRRFSPPFLVLCRCRVLRSQRKVALARLLPNLRWFVPSTALATPFFRLPLRPAIIALAAPCCQIAARFHAAP